MLLVDAIKRTMRASDIMAIYAVIVDAKNNAAKQFYEGFGFASMQDDSMRLFYRLARSIFKILLQTRHWNLAGQIELREKFFNEIIRHPAPTCPPEGRSHPIHPCGKARKRITVAVLTPQGPIKWRTLDLD